MTEKDSAHSVIINITRCRAFAKASACDLKKYTKKKSCEKVIRKPSDTTLRIYTLPSAEPLRINALKKDNLLLPYKLYAKEQTINKRKQRAAIKLLDRYKITNTELQNRLHVENPPDDVQTVRDIDEKYFRYLNSHHTSRFIPLYKSLKFDFHERLRMKQEIGYRLDHGLSIEENYRKEQETYERSVKKNMDQAKQFDEFIAEDYQRSMETLKKCEESMVLLTEQISLRENLANKQFTIQSRLIGLDYLYFVQQKYGRFLYYLSPPSWRAKHREFAHSVEIEAKGFDLGTSSEEDTFNVIFQNMANECNTGLVKPVLYFSHPRNLMELFENIEKQHLTHFTHVVWLGARARNINKTVQYLKSIIIQDTAWVAHLVEAFVRLVNFCEEREAQLQMKFMKILNGLFHDTVAAPDILKLKVTLEFYYEKLYREESFNNSCFLTAKALENLYMEYLFKLDALSNTNFRKAMKRCIEREANKMRKAHVAARELRWFDRLEHALLRAFEKNTPNVGKLATSCTKRPLTRKLKRPAVIPTFRVSSQRYSLTEAEIEYLRLFTEWTENEDPAKYLHSLSITDRTNSGI